MCFQHCNSEVVLSKAIGNSRRYVLILALQVGLLVIYKEFSDVRRLCHVLQREEYSGLDTYGPVQTVVHRVTV
jgi:hypothetical protein